jgi:hypothetical protein
MSDDLEKARQEKALELDQATKDRLRRFRLRAIAAQEEKVRGEKRLRTRRRGIDGL